MPNNPNTPGSWYSYPDDNPREGQSSKADYSAANVAPLIEMFAAILGVERTQVQLVYPENPVPGAVSHPDDREYPFNKTPAKSSDLLRYEEAAKRSSRLKLFMDNSGAGIDYFT